jgi:hypothetical protein
MWVQNFVILSEDHTLRVYVNRVLSKEFKPKMKEISRRLEKIS